MIKLSLFICLTLFLTGLLPGTAKPEMTVEDTGFEEVEITGLFSVGGKPMVSLSIGNSSSFMLKPGQRRRGIKLLQVQGDNDPYVVLERNGLKGRVFLNKSRPSRTIRVATEHELKKYHGIVYRKGESEPFTGTEIRYYEDGSKRKEMRYVDGKPQGMEIQFREDGSKCMETPWVDGKRIGMEITYYKDGSKFSETPYVDGNANGTGIKYRQDGSKESETIFAKHKWQSKIWYRENGSKWKEMRYDIDPMIMMKSHPHEGIPTYYDENGIKKEEAPMVDGKLNGMVMDYHEDGSKSMETPYVDGKKHGTKIWYDEDGSKRGVDPYVNGKLHGTQTWYHKNGSKSLEFSYLDGKKYGTDIWYYENGNKKEEKSFLEGIRHGTSIVYREDGSKKRELTSLNGRTHGTAVDYQEDGSRAMETLYENGKEISRKEF